MSSIKQFIDKVAALDARPGKDLILSANEAKNLRDDLAKLLVDKLDAAKMSNYTQATSVVISGGTFK
jgi:hypothetical protein